MQNEEQRQRRQTTKKKQTKKKQKPERKSARQLIQNQQEQIDDLCGVAEEHTMIIQALVNKSGLTTKEFNDAKILYTETKRARDAKEARSKELAAETNRRQKAATEKTGKPEDIEDTILTDEPKESTDA